ncbi:MAG: TetR family transcriptional regulator [Gammaproteobacteria bacterium]
MSATAHKESSRSGARQQLIAAAEKLFAESGIDAVSLRQINVAAGQKNSSAAHYHFGSKDALILAIYGNRMASVNLRREAAIDQLEVNGQQNDIRKLVETIVEPIVEEIDADASGRNYIGFMAQAMGHPQLDLEALWQQENNTGLVRLLEHLRSALPHLEDPLFGQRFGLAFEQIIHSLADRERLRDTAQFDVNSQMFVSNLIDSIAGGMSAPVSDATLAHLKALRLKK